jgi:predicted transcriptional regulator
MAKATKRKTFHINPDVAYALETLARDADKHIDALAEEALRDYLKKRGRPITVEDALRESVRVIPANDRSPPEKPKQPRRKR